MPTLASFDGAEIFYEVRGDGPPVLLIHGAITDSERNWIDRGIVDGLQTAGRQVVMFDCRGHGRSAKPHDPGAYAGDAMAVDAQRLLDSLRLTKVDVVSYSMGARVAARLAALDGRVRSLVLGGCGDSDAGGQMALVFAGLLEAEDPAALDEASQALRAFVELRGADRQALAAWARAKSDERDRVEVDGITVPTLFLTGVDDEVPGRVEPLLKRLPGARWVRVPGDHFTAPDVPAFLEAIVDFLNEVAPLPTCS